MTNVDEHQHWTLDQHSFEMRLEFIGWNEGYGIEVCRIGKRTHHAHQSLTISPPAIVTEATIDWEMDYIIESTMIVSIQIAW